MIYISPNWDMITNPDDDVAYVGSCMECRFRDMGPHIHNILAFTLRGQEHRAWFRPDFDDFFDQPEYTSWHRTVWTDAQTGETQTLIKLTIDDPPEPKVLVWKLTDTYDDSRKRLGLWPD